MTWYHRLRKQYLWFYGFQFWELYLYFVHTQNIQMKTYYINPWRRFRRSISRSKKAPSKNASDHTVIVKDYNHKQKRSYFFIISGCSRLILYEGFYCSISQQCPAGSNLWAILGATQINNWKLYLKCCIGLHSTSQVTLQPPIIDSLSEIRCYTTISSFM